MPKNIKVLVVDDSVVIRQLLSELLGSDPEIEVVGVASDPYVARDKIKRLNPDVLTLDIEMPRMDGITFLRNLMRLRPMPVVMVSTLTEKGADVTLEALAIGAVDFVTKPRVDQTARLVEYRDDLIAKVKAASQARLRETRDLPQTSQGAKPALAERLSLALKSGVSRDIIAIGASTGGTEAIKDVLAELPDNAPPIVVAQHIPAEFSRSFADRMHRLSRLIVKEAEQGDILLSGHAYIAPGSQHLRIVREKGQLVCRLDQGERVNRHRPSVDVLFDSVNVAAGGRTVAVLLTGMGRDGAAAMQRLHDSGAYTICQDEASSVVWGMPGEAVKLGAADVVLPLGEIAEAVIHGCSRAVSLKEG